MASRGRRRTNDFGLYCKDHPGIVPFIRSKAVALLFFFFPKPRWSGVFNTLCLALLHLILLSLGVRDP